MFHVEITKDTKVLNVSKIIREKGKWMEICFKIKFNHGFTILQNKEPWDLLREFLDIFVWHNDELGIRTLK
jgi:hypothetical protein